MTKTPDFLETAKSHLEALGSELSALENKISEAGQKADAWSGEQAAKLKQDWENARAEMASIAERIDAEGEEAVGDARQKAERHWDALQAAVRTYRDHVEKSVAE